MKRVPSISCHGRLTAHGTIVLEEGVPGDQVMVPSGIARSDYARAVGASRPRPHPRATPASPRRRPGGGRQDPVGFTLESSPIRIAVTSAWARLAAPSFW